MNVNMSAEYRLNQIINSITGQNDIRFKKLRRYPMCILYGAFSETLSQMIQMEMVSRIGKEEAVELEAISSKDVVKDQVRDILNRFRSKMDVGILEKRNRFYVPVIFMADQIDVEEMKGMLSDFTDQMKREGFEGNFEIWFYCIFNYETMDGKECRENIRLLLSQTACGFPIGIYTQDNLSAADQQKYRNAIESMVMHIFLKLSKEDESSFYVFGQEPRSGKYIMGYWKLDVLKQEAAKYLIDSIRRQEEDQVIIEEYRATISDIIEQLVRLDEKSWIERFCRMPVNYAGLKELTKSGRFWSKRPVWTYREILMKLYGREDAFSVFVNSNISEDEKEQRIAAFFSSNIGNLHAVMNRLKGILRSIESGYREEREFLLKERSNYEDTVRLKGNTAEEIIFMLREGFWKADIKIIEAEQRESAVKSLAAYMESEDFKEMAAGFKKRNEEEISRLQALVSRDISMRDTKDVSEIQDTIAPAKLEVRWNEDILENTFIEKALGSMTWQIQSWMQSHTREVLGEFVNSLGDLKRFYYSERYHSARIVGSKSNEEKEYLYIGMEEQDNRDYLKQLQEMASLVLQNIQVIARRWESNTCFELFAIKEIESLEEIYGMD